MSFIKILRRLFWVVFEVIKIMILWAKYDEWTIAEHFRKQGAHIGENCTIHVRTLGREPYLVTIGNNVFISHGVDFHTHDGGTWIFNSEIPDITGFGRIIIEDNCMIGINAQLLPNIRIGKNSIVGANSVVITDIPPNSNVLGVPARVFGSQEEYKNKCIARWKEQKPTDIIEIEPGRNWWSSKYYKENSNKIRNSLMNALDDHLKPLQ